MVIEYVMRRNHAKAISEAISSRVIFALQGNSTDRQSHGVILNNMWDEVCVQVQGAPFFSWEACLDEARQLILGEVSQLGEHDKHALRTVLHDGLTIHSDGEALCDDMAAEFILNQYVLEKAAVWSNTAIEKYLAGRGGSPRNAAAGKTSG